MTYVINKSNINKDTLICSHKEDDFSIYKYGAKPNANLYNYRSIITHNETVVCFSPPKSISRDSFLELHSSKVVVEEYIEGTMVNVFWAKNQWRIASRSKLNANCFFFDTNGHFSNMVQETFQECNLDLNALNKECCYSFVMQHPDNRIVSRFDKPTLYLIAAYRIEDSGGDEVYVHLVNVQSDPLWATTAVKFPATVLNFNINTKPDELCMPYTQMGLVFKNGGIRCKLRNPAYEYVRQLRGNQPKLMYRYFELRKLEKIRAYLSHYPEHATQFAVFRKKTHEYTNTLYNLYVNIYILKTEMDVSVRNDVRFKQSLSKLHQMYITQKTKINITRVIEYVNSLPEAVLMSVV
jgi:hypothetical protein